MTESAPPGNYITEVRVENLFGEFSYRLALPDRANDPRVFILYGDNGTGKTTILKLLRSVLSPENNSGHRGFIATIPFTRFSVSFVNGQKISVYRGQPIAGDYTFEIVAAGRVLSTHVAAEPDLKVKTSNWPATDKRRFDEVVAFLAQISNEVRFLDDKRTFSESPRPARTRHLEGGIIFSEALHAGGDDPVLESVTQAGNSIRREALMRQKRGSGDSQTIYKNLITRIAHGTESQQFTIEGLVKRLVETEGMSIQLAEIGLTTPLDHDELVEQITNAATRRKTALTDLVSAYVESTEAWFSALTELKAIVDKFVGHLNYFIKPKTATFTVSDGLSLLSKTKRPLNVSSLSSGERHLIRMLSQSILMRNSNEVLVIDEPELSLNVKWQRELVNALLDCLGGSSSQVFLATHSIEIASKYRNNVVRLWSNGEDATES